MIFLENGRGIGSSVLRRLCEVLEVEENAFVLMAVGEKNELYGKLPAVTRMLLEAASLTGVRAAPLADRSEGEKGEGVRNAGLN